jgi:hypothetical protein
MARQLLTLEPEPLYRVVGLYKYAGLHNLPMKLYTDRNGHPHEYHMAYVFGPYEAPRTANAMVSRENRHAKIGYRRYYDFSLPHNQRVPYEVSDSDVFVEEALPVWGLHG